jgi:hypothetical protein
MAWASSTKAAGADAWFDVDPEFVVAAAEILDEGVPGADHSRGAEPFQATHGPWPGLYRP